MGAMLQMMQQMMGKGEGKDQKPGKGEGSKPGQGGKGDSDAANTANNGKSKGKTGERRVPKAAGQSGSALPAEFQKTLDAYNKQVKK